MKFITSEEYDKRQAEILERMKALETDSYLIRSLYSLTYKMMNGSKRGRVYVISATQHNTWDFFVGIGKTLDDAILDFKPKVNCYNHKEYPAISDKFQVRVEREVYNGD